MSYDPQDGLLISAKVSDSNVDPDKLHFVERALSELLDSAKAGIGRHLTGVRAIANLRNYWVSPSQLVTLNGNNLLFTAVVLGWAGVIGSFSSILFIGAIGLAFLRLYQGKISFPLDRRILTIAAAFAFYVLADVISGAINYDGWNTISEIIETLPFLGFAFVFGRLALSRREDVERAVSFGVISGAFGTFVLASSEVFLSSSNNVRAEGMAGNPGVLAVISSILYGLCLLKAIRGQGYIRWIALIASICAATTLLLTGMRALWPFIFIGPFIPLLVLRPAINWSLVRFGFLVLAVPLLAMAFFTHNIVGKRIESVVIAFKQIESGKYESSIGQRLVLWKNGLYLAAESPLVGQGPGIAGTRNSKTIGFSHFHNFLLNAMVRSGIIGVVAILGLFIVPLLMLIRTNADDLSLVGLTMLLIIQAVFLLSGSVGIMLGHDIHDTLFIYGTIVASFLAWPEGIKGMASQEPLRTT